MNASQAVTCCAGVHTMVSAGAALNRTNFLTKFISVVLRGM